MNLSIHPVGEVYAVRDEKGEEIAAFYEAEHAVAYQAAYAEMVAADFTGFVGWAAFAKLGELVYEHGVRS